MQKSTLSKKIFTSEEVNWTDNVFGSSTTFLSKHILQTIYINISLNITYIRSLIPTQTLGPSHLPLPMGEGWPTAPIATIIISLYRYSGLTWALTSLTKGRQLGWPKKGTTKIIFQLLLFLWLFCTKSLGIEKKCCFWTNKW